jgi:hypothetical protein
VVFSASGDAVIDTDFERLMNSGKDKEELAWERGPYNDNSSSSASYHMVRLPISSKGWDNGSTGSPDPIGQGEVW